MATLASLVVSLEANVARFESDLNKAEFMARRAMDSISNVSDTAMKAVKGAVAAMAAAYKRINAFTHSLVQANEQYVFQTELIGANARAREIANVKRKDILAVEQQIREVEQSGTQLSIATQQRLRDEAVKFTVTIIKAIDARWEAWQHGWQAIRIKTALASSISDKLFRPTCAGSSTSLKSTFRCELVTRTRPHALRCRNFATSPWSKPSAGWTGHNFVARYLVIAPDKWRVF